MELQFALAALATAFTILDPIGMVPLSLSVTAGVPPDVRRRTIDRAVLVAAAIILFMALVGRYVLSYLGITLPAFSIAGGILLLLISIDMLFARPSGARKTPEEERDAAEQESVAVFPLAIPMIAGPGTIATVLLLVNLSRGDHLRLAIVYAAYALALFATWLAMRGAHLVLRAVGKIGIHVLTRVLGIILSALAVQFILNGLAQAPLFQQPAPARGLTSPAVALPGEAAAPRLDGRPALQRLERNGEGPRVRRGAVVTANRSSTTEAHSLAVRADRVVNQGVVSCRCQLQRIRAARQRTVRSLAC